jgi:RNA polymerase sigma-54 factor
MKQPSLHLGLHTQLHMNPQLQQAIRLLQLSNQALDLEIQSILESNPLLEYENREPMTESDLDSSQTVDFKDEPYSAYQLDTNPNNFEPSSDDSHLEDYLNTSLKSCEHSLQQHLLWQLEVAPFTQNERLIANAIVDVISEDGYCTCTLGEICDTLKIQESLLVNEVEIEQVLLKIQQFDPLGVGARNLSECLSLQINALPDSTLYLPSLKKLASHHLDSLAKRDYPFLKSALKLNEAQLKTVIQKITQLNPNPGRQITPPKKSDYIIPDLIVRKKKNNFVVELNKKAMPKLRINSEYLHLMKKETLIKSKTTKKDLKSSNSRKDNHFFKEHLKEAQWFLKSLNNRFLTLLKVGNCIVEKQQAFLENGEEYMQGLLLQDIAEKTNLHESTVSRITTQKYIDTPRGIFELKYFFSKPLTSPLGKTFSTTAIRATVKKLIQSEPVETPYSDEKIKTLLSDRGIKISRRTISKYRDSLKIPSSHERRFLKQSNPFLSNESTT